jgi:hypothetical protein
MNIAKSLFAALLTIVLAACGQGSDESAEEAAPSAPNATENAAAGNSGFIDVEGIAASAEAAAAEEDDQAAAAAPGG